MGHAPTNAGNMSMGRGLLKGRTAMAWRDSRRRKVANTPSPNNPSKDQHQRDEEQRRKQQQQQGGQNRQPGGDQRPDQDPNGRQQS